MKKTRLCGLLGIDYPIIQAPMDWITGAELAAAVSNAGGLGVMGPNAGARTLTHSVEETGERLRAQIRKAKALTNKPFGVNLVAMEVPDGFPEDAYSGKCYQVILEEGVPVVVFVGNSPGTYVEGLKNAGIKVLHRALPVDVAVAVEAEGLGVDAVVVVGHEGGGHTSANCESTSVLVPAVVDAVKIPVVAGGGICDGRGVVAALALGAEGVYLGTRFIATTECDAHANAKQALVEADETATIALRGTIGIHRALGTPLIQRCQEMVAGGSSLKEVTEAYRSGYHKGMVEGDLEAGAVVCGSCCALVRRVQDAASVVAELVRQTDGVVDGLR